MSLKRFWFLPFLFLTACPIPQRSLSKDQEPAKDQVVLIGRITINHKLPDSTDTIDTTGLLQSAVIRGGKDAKPMPNHISPWDFSPADDLQVKYGPVFSVAYHRLANVTISGIYSFSGSDKGVESYLFPVTGYIRIDPNARYFYIGHIYINVDDYYALKSVKVVDEFAKDTAETSRFKGIHKSLMVVHWGSGSN